MEKNFFDKLEIGQVAETLIARWLRKKGYSILPVYEKEEQKIGGPVFHLVERKVIAPDMLAMSETGKCFFVEAKNKNAFTWHRITERWTTGIDLIHYNDYLEIMRKIEIPIYLIFNHRGGTAKDSEKSDSGLFAQDLRYLRNNENHRCGPKPHCKNGMVFWSKDNLKRIGDALC